MAMYGMKNEGMKSGDSKDGSGLNESSLEDGMAFLPAEIDALA